MTTSSDATARTVPLTELKAWHGLVRHATELSRQPLSALAAQPGRFDALTFRQGPLLLDLSRQRLTRRSLDMFVTLAEQRGFDATRELLFTDNRLNPTEGRAALHTALRAPHAERPAGIADEVEATLAKMASLCADVRGGRWRGHTGKTITHVVNLGIGGSWLGPALVTDALQEHWTRGPEVHFLANIDGTELERLLPKLDAERTLCIVASKSFSTIETRVNALSMRGWFLERGVPVEGLARHFVAVSSNVPAATAFGIAADNVLPMWDWVGGRYSVWSAIGLPVALRYGFDVFQALLAGAHEMDRHFRTAPLARCLPFLLGAAELWNLHFQAADSHTVLCYDHRLKKLPDFLQQLEMESNGKHVLLDGTRVAHHTAPIVWGGEGTNGQHSFHQLLHMGTRNSSTEFILTAAAPHARSEHTHWLHANAIAQGEALQNGAASDADLHREVQGGHPSSSIVVDAVTPAALGALIALYEHKTVTQAALWGINAFDQFGVELGKKLANGIFDALHASDAGATAKLGDATSRALVEALRERERTR
jgi:glucose-6-phosphate isomerase